MKRIISFFILISFAGLMSFVITGDDCNYYYPVKVGDVRAYSHFDKDNQLTGSSTQTVLSTKAIEGGMEIIIGMETKTTGSDSATRNQFTVSCQNGEYLVSMDNFIDPKALEAYRGMEMVVESDNLDLPVNPYAGQKLKDGKITVKVMTNGVAIFNLAVAVTNRQVAAMEDVETPAGTFNCAKITYDVESKLAFIKVKNQAAEWYAKGIGMVKNAIYDKKGRIDSYYLLTALK